MEIKGSCFFSIGKLWETQELWGIVAAHRESQTERIESTCERSIEKTETYWHCRLCFQRPEVSPTPAFPRVALYLPRKSLLAKLGRVGFLSLAINQKMS